MHVARFGIPTAHGAEEPLELTLCSDEQREDFPRALSHRAARVDLHLLAAYFAMRRHVCGLTSTPP